jgi:hypothetical protein
MRLTILLAAAVIAMPAALTAASAPGATQGVTDLSAATVKKKPAKKKEKEEYLKAAPGAGPSGPATKY